MKRSICFLVILLFVTSVTAYAHAGSLDEYGGHVDHETHTYHYHHGWPAHEHYGDYCEYNWIDKTDKGYIGYISQEEYDRQHQHNYSDRDKYVPEDAYHLSEYEALQRQQKENNIKKYSDAVKGWLFFIALIVLLNFNYFKPKKKDKINPNDKKTPVITTTSFVAQQQKTLKSKQTDIEPLTTDKRAQESIIYSEPPPEKGYTPSLEISPYLKKEKPIKKHSSEYWEKVPANIVPVDPYCVYWTPNGKSFHSTDKCIALRKAKVIASGPMAYAFSDGHRTPCSKCVGENYTIK